MNIYALVPLVAVVIYIFLFALLIKSRPWQTRHKLFALFLIAALVWSLLATFFHAHFFMEHKLLLARLTISVFVWAAIQLHHFLTSFYPRSQGHWLSFAYTSLAVLTCLIWLGYIPKSVAIGQSFYPEYDIWLIVMAFPLLILAAKNVYSLRQRFKILSDPVLRNQLAYLITAVCLLVAFVSSGTFIPAWRELPLIPLGNVLVASILTYATVRHELVSIKSITRNGLVYAGIAITAAGFYFSLTYLFHRLGFELDLHTLAAVTLLSGAFLGVFWFFLREFPTWLVDRFFYGKRLDYRKETLDFTRRAQDILSLGNIGKEITRIVAGAIGAKSVSLFIPKKEDFVCEFVFPETESKAMGSLTLRQDSPIVTWLSYEGKYLTRDDLDILPEFRSLRLEERKAIDSTDIKYFLPLIARDRLVAILALTRAKTGMTCDIDDINLLQNLTSQAAIMINNAQLYTKSQDLSKELQLINRLNQILTSSLDINQVYEKFIKEIRKLMDVDWASIALIEGDQLHFFALSTTAGSAWKSGEAIPLKGTATAYVAETKKTLVEKDLLQHHRFWTGEMHIQQGIRSIVYTPLPVRGEVIGALIIGSRQRDAYDAKKVALLELISKQLATVVESNRLYSKVQQKAVTDELTGLFNRRYFEERLSEEIDRHARYGGVFSIIIFDLDFFKIYNDTYGHQAGDKILQEIGRIAKESVRKVDLCFRYGGDEFTLLLPQTPIEEAYQVAERLREQIGMEMKAKEIAVTVSLGIGSWPSDGVTTDDILRAADDTLYYAKQTGGNRSSLFSRIVPSSVEQAGYEVANEKTALSIIHALSATVDAKDHYTYNHSRKVATYAVALAEAAGLPQDKVAIINTAALLHDIGKIGIPDQTLNKTDKLTAEEWESIKSHSTIGATIISYIPSLAPCLPIILHHHERYNGLGYPKKLKAEETPLEARILAIADAFAAMISPHPYRPALSYKEAIEELKKGANTQFDPELVEKFIPITLSLAAKEAIAAKNPDTQSG